MRDCNCVVCRICPGCGLPWDRLGRRRSARLVRMLGFQAVGWTAIAICKQCFERGQADGTWGLMGECPPRPQVSEDDEPIFFRRNPKNA